MNEKSLYQLFKQACAEAPDKTAYRYKKDGTWHNLTWREQERVCEKISRSFIKFGIEKGDKISVLSQTRLEWVQCDIAAVSIGVVCVGIYPTLLADDCAYLLNHSDSVLLVVENKEQLEKVQSIRQNLKKLQRIVIIDGEAEGDDVMTWEELLAAGEDVSGDAVTKRAEALEPQDVAFIVYTSGTTGVPKGAMITHENMVFSSWSACECLYLEPHFETILFLPLAHVFARLIVYFCMRKTLTIAFAESFEKVAENIKEIRPHFFASVPRLFEKVYDKIVTGAQDAGGMKLKIFNWALETGYAVSKLKQTKQPVPSGLAIKYKLANKLVFSKISAALGGRVVWTVSGAAPLNVTLAEFFHACGILILEGIGMTENTSFTNVNRYDNYKFGTVGPPGPGIEQKVAEDGEVLYRGKNVMLGYYKNEEATKEAIDGEGWLHTGDIGEIDEDNFLRITDRKKDLIITAGGKNVAPQRVERILRTSRYISQVVAYGDRKKYLVALITLEQPQIEAWAVEHGIETSNWESLANHEEVKNLIQKEIDEKNKELASFESIKKFIIAPEELTIESGMLTPSMKVKRKKVMEKWGQQLEALYQD